MADNTPWYDFSLGQGFTVGAGGNHDGRDIQTPQGTPLTNLVPGTVTSHTGWYPWGGEVDIQLANGVTETWAHLDAIAVQAGEQVQAGQLIGLSGGEGLPAQYSNGPHTHFSLFGGSPWDNTQAIDPTPLLQWAQQNIGGGPSVPGVGTIFGSAAPGVGQTVLSLPAGVTQSLAQTGQLAGSLNTLMANLQTNFTKYLWIWALATVGFILIVSGLIIAILPSAEKGAGTVIGAAVKAP